MKGLIRFTWCILVFGLAACPAQATFTSLYVFGDTVSTTTTGPGGSSLYYGNRYSNGRVWVEVLAQRQGITYDASKNNSFYDNDSGALVAEINSFAPTNSITNALFIIWVNDADFVDILNQTTTPKIIPPYTTAQLPLWTNQFNLFLTNHFQVITNLYAKGARTLVMPNVVDLTEVPAYVYYLNSSDELFFRQRLMVFDAAFTNTLNSAEAVCPGLTIYVPDYYTLLNNVVSNSAYYGLTNALDSSGKNVDAITANSEDLLPNINTNGPGTNFIFWDSMDPTAQVHEIMADTAQQLISPVQISQISRLNGSNQLNAVNVPIGLSGLVLGSANLAPANWTTVTNFGSTNSAQTILVPLSGQAQFYRLNFPFAWTWP